MTKVNLFPRHSIGEHIVKFNLVFAKSTKASEVIDKIRKDPASWPNVENIIVVDADNKLSGTVEFKKILSSPSSITLENLVTENYPFVTERSHQSNIAKIALKRGAENIPVVDEENHFVGIIDATQILEILHEEHVEELMKFSGILATEEFVNTNKSSLSKIVKGRLPWLILGLLGGMIATIIVKKFELELEKEIALAFFIPVIVYMNDAVGTQTETIFVRFSSLEKVEIIKYLLKEAKVALILAAVLSLLISLFIAIWFNDFKIMFVVSSAMFFGVVGSTFIAILTPWFFQKRGRDPAIGSGPFTTIIQDLLSILIYFTIASIIF